MTEAEWFDCTDPDPMVNFLRGRASVRKHRLFAVACCRRIWSILTNERARWWVETAEQLADNGAIDGDLAAERQDHWEAFRHIDGFRRERSNNVQWLSISAAQQAIQDDDRLFSEYGRSHYCAAAAMAHWHRPNDDIGYDYLRLAEELAHQVPLLRDIFGNPFRPVTFDPRWQTSDVLALARGIYEDRAFERLPLLADALMDAGCADEAILAHCRSPGPHVRGCWVVDLALGKE